MVYAKECGYETIMINCNPETVSTDFDTADKLYFEPVFWEHIYDIIQHKTRRRYRSTGQTALKLAEKLSKYGIKIIGTSFAWIWPRIEVVFRNFNGVKHSISTFGIAETADEAAALADVRLSI
jgi:carbamoyl-phosphate synthase large subunit